MSPNAITATAMKASQRRWAARAVRERLGVLRRARQMMAERADAFVQAISPELARTKADTLVAELLPLLDACRFLERRAEQLLRPRKLGRSGRPLWLAGVYAEVHCEPLGHVLVIGPANFPLFLPGTQVLQALAAGNAVTWKPGAGGAAVAELVLRALREAGLPKGLLRITGESVEAAQDALAEGADKVVFTGSAATGRAVLAQLAETATPAVVELSGADAIVVLPSADLRRVAKAVAFGLRLNGGAVCMSPRRLFAGRATMTALLPLLEAELKDVPAVALDAKTQERLRALVREAVAMGASVREMSFVENSKAKIMQPLLIERASPSMEITRSDIFAPVLSLIEVPSMMHLAEMHAQCRYGLTAAVFGDESEARSVAHSLRVGAVLINDVIAPTADPRVPFGGRGDSGYGVTRGAEGLLEMTAVKTLLVRRGRSTRHLEATTDADTPLFAGVIRALHGRTWAVRWAGIRDVVRSARSRLTRSGSVQFRAPSRQ